MNKLLSIAAALFCAACSLNASAQDSKGSHEFSASCGTTSGTDMIQGFYLNSGRADFDHPTYYSATSKTGNLFLTYRYSVCSRFSIGAAIGTEAITFNHYSNPRFSDPQLLGTYKASITTLALELKAVYLNRRFIQLYGLVGLGGRYYHQTQTDNGSSGTVDNVSFPAVMFNSQWTPVGLRVGKNIGGYAELGIGYKGLANFGIYYKFDNKGRGVVAR